MKKFLSIICMIMLAFPLFSQSRKKGTTRVKQQVATVKLDLSVSNGIYTFHLDDAKLSNGTLKRVKENDASGFIAYILNDQQTVVETIYLGDPLRNTTDDSRSVTLRFNYRPDIRHIQIHRIGGGELVTLGSVPLYLHKPDRMLVNEPADQ